MQRQRQRRIRIGAIVALIALFGLLVGSLAATTGSSSTSSSTSTTTTTAPATTTTVDPATLTGAARELYDRVTAGRSGTWHVQYVLTGSAVPSDATAAALEIWRAGGQLRQETRLEQPTGLTHSVDIGGPTGTVACAEKPGAPLSCQQVSVQPLGADQDVLTGILEQLGPAPVTVRDDSIAGVAARCYDIAGGGSAASGAAGATVCVTAEGVPVSFTSDGLVATATLVGTDVDPSLFSPPVPLAGTASESSAPPASS